ELLTEVPGRPIEITILQYEEAGQKSNIYCESGEAMPSTYVPD
ncbi:8695_t:CDS:1, partial [Ambispora gerdemannii]